MLTNAPEKISRQRDSRPTDLIVRRWIVAIAELCGKDITDPLVELWCRLLSDIEPQLLDRALEETAKTCGRFFPTPGEVRARINQVESKGLQLEAEAAWNRAMDYALNCWHPDIGFTRNAPELPAKLEHAIRAAGGIRCLHNCPESELHWRKKDFVGDYVRVQELGREQHLLSDSEAKMILKQLSSESQNTERKQLIAENKPLPESLTNEGIRALTNQVVKRLPTTLAHLTAEEESRRREQLRRQEEMLRSIHPDWFPKEDEVRTETDAMLALG